MAYKPRDRIFAKVKGHPHWPARINILPEDVKVPKGKYPIFFYGTHEVYFLASKDIYPYDEWKHKYSINKPRPAFQKGLYEIENSPDILLYGEDDKAVKFLSQFYDFKQSTPSNCAAPDSSFDNAPEDVDESCFIPRKTKSIKESQKHCLVSDSELQPRAKNKNTGMSPKPLKNQPAEPSKIFLPENSTPQNEKPSFIADNGSKSKERRKTKTPINSEVSRQRKVDAGSSNKRSPPVSFGNMKSLSPQTPGPTTALGRPMRLSASQFSAKRLLRAGVVVDDDEGSSEDADWNPMVSDGNDDDVFIKNNPVSPVMKISRRSLKKRKIDQKSSSKLDGVSRILSTSSSSSASSDKDSSIFPTKSDRHQHRKRMEYHQRSRKRLLSPTVHNSTRTKPISRESQAFSANSSGQSRLKPSNVSMEAGELNSRLTKQRPNQQRGQKELKELGAEVRLHFIDRAIKTSLIRGQENIDACLQRLELLEKMELNLPVLVKCSAIIETIRKCSRYKPSMDVKIAALRVFNRFLKIQENASKEEMDEAHAELLENNRRLPSSTVPSGPKSVADLFQGLRQSTSLGIKAPPTITLPEPAPPVQSISPPAEVSSTSEMLPPPPPPISPPPLPLPPSSPHDHSPLVVMQGTPASPSPPPPTNANPDGSDSEGLAPSLGGLEGEESADSDETPLTSLPAKSPLRRFTVEATMAAVKQAFLQRTRELKPSTPISTSTPPLPPESDKCVPQSVHSSSNSVPPYVPVSTLYPSTYIPTVSALPTSTYQTPPSLMQQAAPSVLPVDSGQPPMQQQNEEEDEEDHPRRTNPSPETRRRPGRRRQRASSPHALPHPLEHYQKILNNNNNNTTSRIDQHPPSFTPPQKPLVQSVGSDDLDTRIARLLQLAGPQAQHPAVGTASILSPPPPPPPLPSSQNLILAHRPPHDGPIEPSTYTPDSPVQDGLSTAVEGFDPISLWSLPQGADSTSDVYKALDI